MQALTDAPQPTKKARHGKSEMHSTDYPAAQPDPIVMPPIDQRFEAPDPHVQTADHAAMHKAYLDELTFNEEPVTVLMHPTAEKFASPFVECTVNGKGVEIFVEGYGWLEIKQIPVNKAVTVKRKYVEVWARAKHTDVRTNVTGQPGDGKDPINEVLRTTSLRHPFSVIEDRNPRGKAWLEKLLRGVS